MSYYIKPHDVRYTDMCIWIDKNAYSEDCDDNLLFEYLFHIFRMLAYKKHFFEKAVYYDDFAIYSATQLFLRYRNDRFGGSAEKRIKSVLNYAKAVLYPRKVSFQEQEFAQNYVRTNDAEQAAYDNYFHGSIMDKVDCLKVSDFNAYFDDISKTVRAFVKKLPRKSESEMWNIYLSCMLTLLNSVTLKQSTMDKLIGYKESGYLKQYQLDKVYKEERENSIILYHLDDSMEGYIKVLVNEIRHMISEDMSAILNENLGSEWNMQNLLISEVSQWIIKDD